MIADLEGFNQILAQIEVDPQVAEIYQGYQWHAG